MRTIAYGIAALVLLLASAMAASADDPAAPSALPPLDALSAADAVSWLEGLQVFQEQDYLKAAVMKAFGSRSAAAVSHAIDTLGLPGRDRLGRAIAGRDKAHFVARIILQSFPEVAAGRIVAAYASGDVVARSNLISVAGTIAGSAVTTMLRSALDDTTAFDDHDPERSGPPLRLCDLAYNQLVLRFRLSGVLRTIGPAHRIENRDYHIAVLKVRL